MTDQELTAAREALELLPQWDAPLCASERQIWWNAKAGLLEDARAAAMKLLAELDRFRVARRWLPIETAPREAILVASKVGDKWVTGEAWYEEHPHGCWWWARDTPNYEGLGGPIRPTHWMPLPDGPDA